MIDSYHFPKFHATGEIFKAGKPYPFSSDQAGRDNQDGRDRGSGRNHRGGSMGRNYAQSSGREEQQPGPSRNDAVARQPARSSHWVPMDGPAPTMTGRALTVVQSADQPGRELVQQLGDRQGTVVQKLAFFDNIWLDTDRESMDSNMGRRQIGLLHLPPAPTVPGSTQRQRQQQGVDGFAPLQSPVQQQQQPPGRSANPFGTTQRGQVDETLAREASRAWDERQRARERPRPARDNTPASGRGVNSSTPTSGNSKGPRTGSKHYGGITKTKASVFAPAPAPARAPMQRGCGKCGRVGHTVSNCCLPWADGFVHGCPICNGSDHHTPEGCRSAWSTSPAKVFQRAVTWRANKPPLLAFRNWASSVQMRGGRLTTPPPWTPYMVQALVAQGRSSSRMPWLHHNYLIENRSTLPVDAEVARLLSADAGLGDLARMLSEAPVLAAGGIEKSSQIEAVKKESSSRDDTEIGDTDNKNGLVEGKAPNDSQPPTEEQSADRGDTAPAAPPPIPQAVTTSSAVEEDESGDSGRDELDKDIVGLSDESPEEVVRKAKLQRLETEVALANAAYNIDDCNALKEYS
ncbi:Zinc finger, CCHC-type [Akanthomyces lecanii RCEF 1005]|uniref:Zinc finger, CCHC-type n=1 Tax=Akanthomyces lecanii RCEF 1005 TaxID=1081108 RepID=A0A168FN36_CORDF|nr:Zinc finger, CCHC-type [Akanthomyces lecanii RCEF 1005]